MSDERRRAITQNVDSLWSLLSQPAASPGQRQHDHRALRAGLDLLEGALHDLNRLADAAERTRS